MTAMHKNGNATVHWERKAENYRMEYALRETQMPEIFAQA